MIDLEHVFSYHAPRTAREAQAYEEIREAAKVFARTIERLVPTGADCNAAIREVRNAMMTANAGIALEGRLRTNKRWPKER